MATITTLIATMQQTEEFEKGFKGGFEMYEECAIGADEIKTHADVWSFLETEFSPQSLMLNKLIAEIHDVPEQSLSSHVGFLVGYLTRAFTESQK